MSISEIARQIHMSRNTMKKHLRLDKPLEYKRKRRKSKLDPEKRRESNINRSTLWYQQKKIKEGWTVRVYSKTKARIELKNNEIKKERLTSL